MTEITVRDVLRLLLEADSYPRQSNDDWGRAERMEAAALEKIESAIGYPDDPPEFRAWLETLRKANMGNDEREAIYEAMYGYFGCPRPWVRSALRAPPERYTATILVH